MLLYLNLRKLLDGSQGNAGKTLAELLQTLPQRALTVTLDLAGTKEVLLYAYGVVHEVLTTFFSNDDMPLLQQAVNTISEMLMNLTDADDDRNPESGVFYGDVRLGALFLDRAIQAGILPENYNRDRVASLIERVKSSESEED